MAATVLRTYLGDKWCDINLIGKGDPYLTQSVQDETGSMKSQDRIIALAEMVFNLQYKPGADARFERLTKVSVETAIAELQAARLLATSSIPFRFVLEKKRKKQDYDIELTAPNGKVVCYETKCKLESTKLSETSLLKSLKKAVKQLPNSTPGIVFIKFPETWKRIVKVVVHWEVSHRMRTGSYMRLSKFREIENQQSSFFDPKLVNFIRAYSPLWKPPSWKYFIDAIQLSQHSTAVFVGWQHGFNKK
jgi:hypothetical protein